MIFHPTKLQGSYEIILSPFADSRGWFVRTYSKDEFARIGFSGEWLQINHSYTREKGTIRGMHFQVQPFREVKLVRCVRGEVFDVIIDVRKNSATFLQWVGIKLSGERMNMIYIPEGFAHGFQTLTDDCELIYLHSEYYKPGFEGGIRYDDAAVAIDWPLAAKNISERDSNHPVIDGTFKGI